MSVLRDFAPFDIWISKSNMIKGTRYLYRPRNFKEGVWNGESFDYMRTKFNMVFQIQKCIGMMGHLTAP